MVRWLLYRRLRGTAVIGQLPFYRKFQMLSADVIVMGIVKQFTRSQKSIHGNISIRIKLLNGNWELHRLGTSRGFQVGALQSYSPRVLQGLF